MTVNIMPMFSLEIIHRLSEKICIESINVVSVLEVLALWPWGCTGWSNKTVNCNFFVTGVKITENYKTQPFLEMPFWVNKAMQASVSVVFFLAKSGYETNHTTCLWCFDSGNVFWKNFTRTDFTPWPGWLLTNKNFTKSANKYNQKKKIREIKPC